jgi:pSer/pThr/pTyr-binding forkhead associated (FHA) protein
VRRTPHGYEVADVGSLNGTYVDHKRVDTAPLHHLADLQIGRFVLVFLVGSDAE